MPAIIAPRFKVIYGWEAGEDFWGGPMNQNMVLLDALLHPYIQSMTFSAPPQNTQDGDQYLVANGGTGDWAGHDGEMATRVSGTWVFFVPTRGVRVRVASLAAFLWFDGAVWLDEQTGVPPGQDPSVVPIYYDIGLTVPYAVEASEILLYQPILQALILPVNGNGSAFRLSTNSPGAVILTIRRNALQVGTISIASGSSSGTFSIPSPVSLGAGDILSLHAPSEIIPGFRNFGMGLRLRIAGV